MQEENTNNDILKIKEEIREYHPIKKIPLVLDYLVDSGLKKFMPKCYHENSTQVKGSLFKYSKIFITLVFPLVFIYQRDRDCENDSPFYFEDE